MAEYDVVVVGSGFGGSVAALRLVEKGYRVLVLEAGRRFTDATLPRTSWDVSRFLWAPRLGWLGIQRIHVLPDVVVLAGAGVGGGSLNPGFPGADGVPHTASRGRTDHCAQRRGPSRGTGPASRPPDVAVDERRGPHVRASPASARVVDPRRRLVPALAALSGAGARPGRGRS